MFCLLHRGTLGAPVVENRSWSGNESQAKTGGSPGDHFEFYLFSWDTEGSKRGSASSLGTCDLGVSVMIVNSTKQEYGGPFAATILL